MSSSRFEQSLVDLGTFFGSPEILGTYFFGPMTWEKLRRETGEIARQELPGHAAPLETTKGDAPTPGDDPEEGTPMEVDGAAAAQMGATPAEDATPVDVADAAEEEEEDRAEESAVVGEEPKGGHAWKTRPCGHQAKLIEERRAEKAEEVPDSASAVVRPDEGDVVARRAAEDKRMKDEHEDRELRRRTIRECRRPALVRADEEKEEYRAEESAAVGEEPAEGDDAKYGQDAATSIYLRSSGAVSWLDVRNGLQGLDFLGFGWMVCHPRFGEVKF